MSDFFKNIYKEVNKGEDDSSSFSENELANIYKEIEKEEETKPKENPKSTKTRKKKGD